MISFNEKEGFLLYSEKKSISLISSPLTKLCKSRKIRGTHSADFASNWTPRMGNLALPEKSMTGRPIDYVMIVPEFEQQLQETR